MNGHSFYGQKLDWLRYVLADHLLGSAEKVVAAALLQWVNEGDGGAFTAQDTIADATGLNPRTVQRALTALARRGWILKEQLRGRRSNLNVLTYDWRLLEPIDVLLSELEIAREDAARARKALLARHR